MFLQKVHIPSEGVTLEGEINRPEKFDEGSAVVLCHPHPLFGGDMYNNVISALFYALPEKRMLTLRFNFRGVGRSQGKYESGIGEKADVNAVIKYLKMTFPQVKEIIVAGYSFGAWVGLLAASENKWADILIAIAPPITLFNFDYFRNMKKPKFFVIGDSDEFIPLKDFMTFYEEIPSPKKYIIIRGADHFFHGHESEIAKTITDLLDKQV
ncbi:MAG: dienelactone hydrolase family protein [Candidatus Jordarchaeales archaeon]|nr:dienelactone hydrolase family protein [Candidatus Jordarchaeia archaeon]